MREGDLPPYFGRMNTYGLPPCLYKSAEEDPPSGLRFIDDDTADAASTTDSNSIEMDMDLSHDQLNVSKHQNRPPSSPVPLYANQYNQQYSMHYGYQQPYSPRSPYSPYPPSPQSNYSSYMYPQPYHPYGSPYTAYNPLQSSPYPMNPPQTPVKSAPSTPSASPHTKTTPSSTAISIPPQSPQKVSVTTPTSVDNPSQSIEAKRERLTKWLEHKKMMENLKNNEQKLKEEQGS